MMRSNEEHLVSRCRTEWGTTRKQPPIHPERGPHMCSTTTSASATASHSGDVVPSAHSLEAAIDPLHHRTPSHATHGRSPAGTAGLKSRCLPARRLSQPSHTYSKSHIIHEPRGFNFYYHHRLYRFMLMAMACTAIAQGVARRIRPPTDDA